MVWDIFLKPFLLLSCFIGNSVSEGVISKNYRFKTFSVDFLEASSVKTDVSDLIRKFTQTSDNTTVVCFKVVQSDAHETMGVEGFIMTEHHPYVNASTRYIFSSVGHL